MKRDEHSGPGVATKDGVSRRGFLKGAGGAAAGTMLVGAAHEALAAEAGATAPPGFKLYEAAGADISLSLNGKATSLKVTPQTTLLQAVRETVGMTGAKEVCDRGACGACTMIVDGRSVNSCMMLAVDAVGSKITTVEGLKQGDKLDPVQQAFIDHDACQCGFCIPGFVVRSRVLLDEQPKASREEIKEGLCGNICRCAAYTRIFDAVESVAKGGRG